MAFIMKHLNSYKKQRKSYKPLILIIGDSIFGGMKVHENIRTLRHARCFTQQHMAKKLGMDVANYSRIERGVAKLTVERLKEIADILNTGITELVNVNIQNAMGQVNDMTDAAKVQDLLKQNNLLLEVMLGELRKMRSLENEK